MSTRLPTRQDYHGKLQTANKNTHRKYEASIPRETDVCLPTSFNIFMRMLRAFYQTQRFPRCERTYRVTNWLFLKAYNPPKTDPPELFSSSQVLLFTAAPLLSPINPFYLLLLEPIPTTHEGTYITESIPDGSTCVLLFAASENFSRKNTLHDTSTLIPGSSSLSDVLSHPSEITLLLQE